MNQIPYDTIPVENPAPCVTVLVPINNPEPIPWSYAAKGADAHRVLARGRAYYEERAPEFLPIVAMSEAQFAAYEVAKLAAMIETSVEATDADRYDEMLGALPPASMGGYGGVDSAFIVGEPIIADCFRQFARLGDQYATKLVRPRDRSTWLTPDEIQAANASD